MNRVKNKVAIVTGGAVGLGRSQAQLLAKEGASVIVTDIKESEGQQCVKEIQEAKNEIVNGSKVNLEDLIEELC